MSGKNLKLIKNPLSKENPITVQVLGICSALAVTAQVKPALVMAISVIVVVALSNVIISLLRNTIPPRIRIIVQLLVVAMMVILVDQFLKAFVYDVQNESDERTEDKKYKCRRCYDDSQPSRRFIHL